MFRITNKPTFVSCSVINRVLSIYWNTLYILGIFLVLTYKLAGKDLLILIRKSYRSLKFSSIAPFLTTTYISNNNVINFYI